MDRQLSSSPRAHYSLVLPWLGQRRALAAKDVLRKIYHVPDVPAAVAELRRIVKPGGTLLASTNSGGVFVCR